MDMNLFWQVPLVLISFPIALWLGALLLGLMIRSVIHIVAFPWTCVDAYRHRRNINRALKEAEEDDK